MTIRSKAEAARNYPFEVRLGRDVGDRALALDQVADAARIVSLVAEHDGARDKPVEQPERGGSVVRLAHGQAEPDREPLGIDERVNLGREAAPRATETTAVMGLF